MKLIETTARFANNPDYVRYENLAIQLVAAVAADDEDLADRLSDEMDEPASRLHTSEILRLNGLAGDLYSLYDQELLDTYKGTPEQYTLAVKAAQKKNDYVSILGLLRKQQNAYDAAQVAFMRGFTYHRLGHKEIGIQFIRKAMDLAPDRVQYGWLYFSFLVDLHRFHEIERLAKQIIEDEGSRAELRIQAGATLHEVARSLSQDEAFPLHRLAEHGILDGLNNLQGQGSIDGLDVRTDAYTALGSIYYSLGQIDNAISALNSAIQLNPNEEDAYGMRGLLLRNVDRVQSKQDLLRAIKISGTSELNIQSPSLYVALCQLLIDEGDWAASKKYAQSLLHIANDSPESALAHEFLAISELGLSGPNDTASEHFRTAAELYPSNQAIAKNLSVYKRLQQDLLQDQNGKVNISSFNLIISEEPLAFHTNRSDVSKLLAVAV